MNLRRQAKETSRRRLLQAARELVVEVGYGALSARQVSARAGLAQSSFYAHFKDKEELFQVLADEIVEELRVTLHTSRAEVQDWGGAVAVTASQVLSFFMTQRDLVALVFQELDVPGSPVGLIGRRLIDTLHTDLCEDLQAGILTGRLPPLSVDAMAHVIVGTAIYALRRILAGHVEDPQALVEDFIGVAYRVLGARG